MPTTMSSTRAVVDQYFDALKRKDFVAMRTLLHDDVTFKGALGATEGAEEYIGSLKKLTEPMIGVERQVVCGDGEDICQIYDLTFETPAVTLPIAQWLTIRDNRITRVRVFFDPRPLLQPAPA